MVLLLLLIYSCCLQALICRALFPRVLRLLLSRLVAFGEYSVTFEEVNGRQLCFVSTWEDNSLLDICVGVEVLQQRVAASELASLSRVVCALESGQMPLSIRGGPQSFLSVLSDSRTDGRLFIYCREFTSDTFMQCYRQADQEIFGMLEVSAMIDYLMLRLKTALPEPWMEDVSTLRRCVIGGSVDFVDLQAVIRELLTVWKHVREFVRYTGPRHAKSASDKVIIVHAF